MKMKAAQHATTGRRADEPPRLNRADVDPDLERQLISAASDAPVEAVLILRRDDTGARCVATSDSLLKRVCGSDPDAVLDSHYLPRLGVLIVRACPSIIRQLIAQPEVAIACANRTEVGQPAPTAQRVRHKEMDR
jgi:hypothetical protein